MRTRKSGAASTSPSGCLRVAAWIGLILSALLIAAALWFHVTADPLLRIPFVLVCGGGGILIGLGCLGYLVTGRID